MWLSRALAFVAMGESHRKIVEQWYSLSLTIQFLDHLAIVCGAAEGFGIEVKDGGCVGVEALTEFSDADFRTLRHIGLVDN